MLKTGNLILDHSIAEFGLRNGSRNNHDAQVRSIDLSPPTTRNQQQTTNSLYVLTNNQQRTTNNKRLTKPKELKKLN